MMLSNDLSFRKDSDDFFKIQNNVRHIFRNTDNNNVLRICINYIDHDNIRKKRKNESNIT